MSQQHEGSDEGAHAPGQPHVAHEYAAAIELVRGLREVADSVNDHQVRYWSLPASKISADFFCSAEHAENGWFCMLADAAGHGLASAIFSLHTPILFREAVLMGFTLPAIYARINRFLQRQNISSYFVCGTLVRVHERDIEVLNAGMPDVLLLSSDGRLADTFPSRHLPFGISHGARQGDAEIAAVPQRYRLARHEKASLLLYSDGLSELEVFSGDALGVHGLLATAQENPETLFDRLVERVNKSAPRIHDDVSFALLSLPLVTRDSPDPIKVTAGLGDANLDRVKSVAAALRIVENYDRGLVLTDADTRILYVNPAFTAFTGYSFEESLGQNPRMLSSGRHDANFYREMWVTLQSEGVWCGEIWNRRKDGTLYLEWLEIRVVDDIEGQPRQYLASFTPIKQQQGQDERLRFLALHDSLTGLANRVLLADRGNHAIHRADRSERALAVLFIDLDRFKSINDSLGHDIGDEVLVQVARRMEAALREEDTLARFGGDEFICLLSDIADRQDAGRVANKLLAALDSPIDVAGHHFKVGASIGISAYPSDGLTFDDLVVAADRAMMRAKQAGGNIAKFFSSEMAVAVERQLEMEARLDAAIRTGQLELFYQPKFDLINRTIIGAEALVRWRDPERGLIPPGVFIPIAERSDLISKIGNWVLTAATGMLARRKAELPPVFHVAVNVSPLQFERCDVAGQVRKVLDRSGISPSLLQIEVTESTFIRDENNAGDVLQSIAAMGVKVALDDFGTGYSNLGSLIHLPLDTFKLDQQFVRDVDQNASHASVARSVWFLADGLKKNIVAEGIETCEECARLTALGYRIGQGYLFGKPMPEDEFFAHLTNWCPASCVCPEPA